MSGREEMRGGLNAAILFWFQYQDSANPLGCDPYVDYYWIDGRGFQEHAGVHEFAPQQPSTSAAQELYNKFCNGRQLASSASTAPVPQVPVYFNRFNDLQK